MGPGAAASGRHRKSHRSKLNVKAACEECRSRKTKCDGIRPTCLRCAKREMHCEYDAEPDEYRSITLRRKCKEYERQATASAKLLRILREASDEDAISLLQRVRSNESVESILASLDRATETQHPSPPSQTSPPLDITSDPGSSSVATSSTSPTELSPNSGSGGHRSQAMLQQPPRPPLAHRTTLSMRSRSENPLAIAFLINSDEHDCSPSPGSPRVRSELDETATVPPLRTSSYSPLKPRLADYDTLEQATRSSVQICGAQAMQLQGAWAAKGITMAAEGPGPAAEKFDIPEPKNMSPWDDYYTNVSSLFRRLGRPEKGNQ